MKSSTEIPEIVDYHCNVCGAQNRLPRRKFHRELAACAHCGSNARFRGIVAALAGLLGLTEAGCLAAWPSRKGVCGVGMSDWPGYAALLAEKFSYENTFFDSPPQLDIQSPAAERLGKYDFVISSDVFEHIVPPLQQGFDQLLALLKPGGGIVFSVPYTRDAQTIEHYPGLHEFELLEFHGASILVNRDAAGALQVYDNLVFHGGGGATLEMRLFCEADVLSHLARAGFVDIRVHEQPQLAVGYYWEEWPEMDRPEMVGQHPLTAYVITARRPGGHDFPISTIQSG